MLPCPEADESECSHGLRALFSSPDLISVGDREDENFPITGFAGMSAFSDSADSLIRRNIVDHTLNFNLLMKVNSV